MAREDVTKEGVGQTDDDQQQIGRVASKSESGGGRKGSQALMGGQLVHAPGYMMRSSCVTGSLCSVVLEPFMICKACYSFRKHFAKLLAFTKDSLEPGNTASVHTPELPLSAFCSPSLGWSGNSSLNRKQNTENHCVAKVRNVS